MKPNQSRKRRDPVPCLPANQHRIAPHPHRKGSAIVNAPSLTTTDNQTDTLPLILTIEQAAKTLGVGRTLMYGLVMNGDIESVTIGRLRRIPAEALTDYVARLRTATRQPAAA